MDLITPAQKIIQLLYPPRCLLCHQPGHDGMDLCRHCYQTLPWNRQACHGCALPLPLQMTESVLCGRCLQHRPEFDSALSLFRYEAPVTTLIQRMKFNEKLAVIRLMTQLIAARPGALDHTECVLPVPLHKKRLRQRGFNQSAEIVRPLAKAGGCVLLTDTVIRARDTPQQTGLDARARRKNIRGAFELVKPLRYKNITIVDDVITTGSTVNELARVLKRNGAERVHVLSLARAL